MEMDVNQLYLEYEQEIIEVLEGDKHLKEIIGLQLGMDYL